jgi:hypothetical protein
MDMKQIKDRIDRIKACAGDDESAHSQEDGLMRDFIEFIAISEGCDPGINDMAHEVLKTDDIEFARWCA